MRNSARFFRTPGPPVTATDTIRRWAYCRCRYARPPAAPCVCTPAVLARAERETPEQTRRWEKTLAARDEGGSR